MIIWPTKKLGEVCSFISPGIKEFSGIKKYVATADIDGTEIINSLDISYSDRPDRANIEVLEKDVLVARMAQTKKFLLANTKHKNNHIFSTGFVVLRVHKDVDPSYLFYFLTSKDFNLQKDRLATGATQKAINNGELRKIQIPLPPLEIQKQIVERLDKIAEAQKLNDGLIQKTDELFQSLLHKELNSVGKNWGVKKLDEIAKIIMGQSPPSTSYNESGNGLPFFQGKADFGDLYPNTVKYCSAPSRIAEPEDILISVRAPVGDINLTKDKSCIGRGLAAIRGNNKIVEQMLLYFLFKKNEKNWQRQSTGSTFAAITKDKLTDYKIPMPPLDTQKQIVAKLSAVQDYKKQLLRQKAKLKELFDSALAESMTSEKSRKMPEILIK